MSIVAELIGTPPGTLSPVGGSVTKALSQSIPSIRMRFQCRFHGVFVVFSDCLVLIFVGNALGMHENTYFWTVPPVV